MQLGKFYMVTKLVKTVNHLGLLLVIMMIKGPVIIYCRGWGRRENGWVNKNCKAISLAN